MIPSWRWLLILAWLAVLAMTAHRRLDVWQNEETLWADAAAKAPLKPRPVLNLGRVHELRGDLGFAEQSYRDVIHLASDRRRGDWQFAKAAAESNLAHVFIKQGRFASAMTVIEHGLFEFPAFPYLHYNRGAILWQHGACDDAQRDLTTARASDPNLAEYPEPCGLLRSRSSSSLPD
jgi:tetratricopeptide (TPR) repeat protein